MAFTNKKYKAKKTAKTVTAIIVFNSPRFLNFVARKTIGIERITIITVANIGTAMIATGIIKKKSGGSPTVMPSVKNVGRIMISDMTNSVIIRVVNFAKNTVDDLTGSDAKNSLSFDKNKKLMAEAVPVIMVIVKSKNSMPDRTETAEFVSLIIGADKTMPIMAMITITAYSVPKTASVANCFLLRRLIMSLS